MKHDDKPVLVWAGFAATESAAAGRLIDRRLAERRPPVIKMPVDAARPAPHENPGNGGIDLPRRLAWKR